MSRGIAAVRDGGLAEDTSCSSSVVRVNGLELEGSWGPVPEFLELNRMRSASSGGIFQLAQWFSRGLSQIFWTRESGNSQIFWFL